MEGRQRQQPDRQGQRHRVAEHRRRDRRRRRFELHTNPSTRPFLSFQGKSEAYTLTAGGVRRDVVVDRGQTTAVGDLVTDGSVLVTAEETVTVG